MKKSSGSERMDRMYLVLVPRRASIWSLKEVAWGQRMSRGGVDPRNMEVKEI